MLVHIPVYACLTLPKSIDAWLCMPDTSKLVEIEVSVSPAHQ